MSVFILQQFIKEMGAGKQLVVNQKKHDALTPPEQPGPNAGVHDSTHTFTVKFGQACGPDDLQMAYQ